MDEDRNNQRTGCIAKKIFDFGESDSCCQVPTLADHLDFHVD